MNDSFLLAEDDPVAREILTVHLDSLGFRSKAVTKFHEAEKLLREEPFICLILDRNLPGGTAIDLLTTVRCNASSSNHGSLAIAISAELSGTIRSDLITAGFSAALEKPVSRSVLASTLQSMGIQARLSDGYDTLFRAQNNLLVLDDDHALLACGDQSVVKGLRALLATDFPDYRQQLNAGFTNGDAMLMRDVIHRLKSALGFCGAMQLLSLLNELGTRMPEQATWDQMEVAMERLYRQLLSATH